MWAQPVATAESFDQDLAVLLPQYDELPSVIEGFKRALAANRGITRIPLDDGENGEEFPGVFAQLVDYPPLGPAGKQRFRVTYHAMAERANPWQHFTLLTIVEHPI